MRASSIACLSVVVVVCFGVLAPVAASAQAGASSIAGVVKDVSGAVLPGVTVEAASPASICVPARM
jgi:hypothetical protein